MTEQLAFLIEASHRPNVSLQVLPFDAETYTTASFDFVMPRFGQDAGSDVIYLEDLGDATYLDRPDAVKAYSRTWDNLRAAALGPVESRRLITEVADQFEKRRP
jgi:hypothetical protein